MNFLLLKGYIPFWRGVISRKNVYLNDFKRPKEFMERRKISKRGGNLIMKLVMPLGKKKVTAVANFGIDPQFGCACSNVDGTWLTDKEARIHGGHPDCACNCEYGSENRSGNYTIGYNSDEWNWPIN